MKIFKKVLSIVLISAIIASVCVMGTISSGASGTGIGLAEWALNAYYSGWSYVYGGATPGAVDCSGLIYSYAGGYRVGDAQTFNASYRDYLSNGIPNIHGLGLYKPGHVGVYVGNGMAVDARGDDYGVCYESVYSHGWTMFFKVPGVSYPTSGWQKFNGNYYYYENGEYLANTSRTIDGETYYFASSGISSTTPSNTSSSSSSSTTSSSNSKSTDDSGVLKNGSRGSNVEKLQKRLQELGYYNGAIDGDFGDLTEKAFKSFQKAAGLYVDGIAGSDVDYLYADDAPYYVEEETASKKTDLASTAAKDKEDAEEEDEEEEESDEIHFALGDYDDAIVEIQERLIDLDYLAEGEADGGYGTKTEEAVTDFQAANSLEKTGVVDNETYELLFSNVATKNPNTPTEAPTAIAVPEVEPVVATSAPNTEVEKTSSELSSKSVAGITDSIGFRNGANATNFEFILWLAIMVVVMLITFSIVYAVEKKKSKAAARAGRRFQ